MKTTKLHNCPHCGKPTIGAFYIKDTHYFYDEEKIVRLEMCRECWDYIGSPAAQQEGATMKNRIEMEKRLTA